MAVYAISKRCQMRCLIKETEDRALTVAAKSHYSTTIHLRSPLRETAIMQYIPARSMGDGIRGVYAEKYECGLTDINARINCLLKGLTLVGGHIYWRRTRIGCGDNPAGSMCALGLAPVRRPHNPGYAPFLMGDYTHYDCVMRRVMVRYLLLKWVPLLLGNDDIARVCCRLLLPLCYDETMADIH